VCVVGNVNFRSIDDGNGAQALFWVNRWLDGASVTLLAPTLLSAVDKCRSTRLVRDAMDGSQWIGNITWSLSMQALGEYVRLWEHLQHVIARDT
jgi:hypothetical protein